MFDQSECLTALATRGSDRGIWIKPVNGGGEQLFEFTSQAIVPQGNQFVYSPSPDGQRFLVDEIASDEESTVDVILNWASTQAAAQ